MHKSLMGRGIVMKANEPCREVWEPAATTPPTPSKQELLEALEWLDGHCERDSLQDHKTYQAIMLLYRHIQNNA
jgi:hypothetical protein